MPAGTTGRPARHIFVAGKRIGRPWQLFPGILSGWTNYSWLPAADGSGYYWPANTSGEVDALVGSKTAEVVYRVAGGGWTESRCPIAAVERDTSGGVHMRIAQPCWTYLTARTRSSNANNCSGVGPGEFGAYTAATFIENVPGVLGMAGPVFRGATASRPGDGLLVQSGGSDSGQLKLLYLPRPGERLGQTPPAVLAVSEGLIDAANTSDLAFVGVDFKHSTWLAPSLQPDTARSGGFVEVQAGAHYVRASADGSWCGNCLGRGPAAVQLRKVWHSVISRCSVSNVGSDGVAIMEGSQHNVLSRTTFADISGSAVAIGTVNSLPPGGDCSQGAPCFGDPSLYDTNNSVTDCSTVDTAAEYRGSAAVFVGYARETTISYNDFGATPYSSVSFGWGWSLHKTTWAGSNRVTHNNMHGMMGLLGDGAAVYTLGPQGGQPCGPSFPFVANATAEPPSVIGWNFIHDAGNSTTAALDHGGLQANTHSPGGIYTDQGSTNWNVTGNVIARVDLWLDACRPGGGIGPIFIDGNWRTLSVDCQCSNCCNCSASSPNPGCDMDNMGAANNNSHCPILRTEVISGDASRWPEGTLQVVRGAGVRTEEDVM
jgi:hypothetical protein